MTHVRSAVHALPVGDGPLEQVRELLLVAKVAGPDKVHHAPVLHEVVLQGVACQHDPPPRADLLERLRDVRVVVLDAMALVANNEVRARVAEGVLYV